MLNCGVFLTFCARPLPWISSEIIKRQPFLLKFLTRNVLNELSTYLFCTVKITRFAQFILEVHAKTSERASGDVSPLPMRGLASE